MAEPRLTIGIPHLDRYDRLQKAIDDCLAQTTPCRVLVADQKGTDATARLMGQYRDHPLVRHERTGATCLWENWDAAARLAAGDGTEFFAWLQDDDRISRGYAERVAWCFDGFPMADVWTAYLQCADEQGLALRFLGNGPWCGLRALDGSPRCFGGEVLVPLAYVTSWALSPAVAFRRGPAFDYMLNVVPHDADLYAERTVLAAMGPRTAMIADPLLAGYWVQHAGNEHRRQHKDQERQTQVMVDFIDDLMDKPGFSATALTDFADWAADMPLPHLQAWLGAVHGINSRYRNEVGQVLLDAARTALPASPEMVPGGLGELTPRARRLPGVRGYVRRLWDAIRNAPEPAHDLTVAQALEAQTSAVR